jgi:polyisoprenoid-binding protein YceI
MSSTAVAAPYQIDVGHSSVIFKIKHFNIGYTFGSFSKFKGQIEEGASVELVVDAASVDSQVAKRDDHLRGPDFFNVKQFPEISFKSTRWETTQTGATITGALTFHGVTQEVSLNVEKVGAGTDPWNNERIGYYGELTIKRSDFGVSYGIKEGSASDELTLLISLEGVRKKE